MALKLRVHLQVIHPDPKGADDSSVFNQRESRVCLGLATAFRDSSGSKWVVEPSYSDLEEEEPCIITFKCTIQGLPLAGPRAEQEIRNLCEALFDPDNPKSLKRVPEAEDVWFKPAGFELAGKRGDARVDVIFLRCFILAMAKRGQVLPKSASEIAALRTSLFTKDSAAWFFGPMKAAVTVANCTQALGEFLLLIPDAETIAKHPATGAVHEVLAAQIGEKPGHGNTSSQTDGAEHLQRKIQMVLDVIRGAASIQTWLRNMAVFEVEDLDEAGLHNEINNVAATLSQRAGELNALFNDMLIPQGHEGGIEAGSSENGTVKDRTEPEADGNDTKGGEGETEKDEIKIKETSAEANAIEAVADKLISMNSTTSELMRLSDLEFQRLKEARNTWATGTALSALCMAISLFLPGGAVVPGVAFGSSTVSCIVCGSKIYVRWRDMGNTQKVREQVDRVAQVFYDTWLFLTLVLWRQAGMPDSDEALTNFASNMAKTFNINELLEHWADPSYISATIGNSQRIIEKGMEELLEKVKGRIHPQARRWYQ